MPNHQEGHKQISISRRKDICGWVVTIGRQSRFLSKMTLGSGYEDIARRFYAKLGIRLGFFYPPEKANMFFVRKSERALSCVWHLCRYALSKDGYYTKIEVFRAYTTKDGESRALSDLNQIQKTSGAGYGPGQTDN